MKKNTLLILFLVLILSSFHNEGRQVEITRNDYSLEEIVEMAKRPLSNLSKIINHPNPLYSSDSGYSYFLEIYGNGRGNNFVIGEKFKGDQDYRFDDGCGAIRFFRDKRDIVKMLCTYQFFPNLDSYWLDGIFFEVTQVVVMDTLTETNGYMALSLDINDPKYKYDKHQYVIAIQNGKNEQITVYVSKSIIQKKLRNQLDGSARNVWAK